MKKQELITTIFSLIAGFYAEAAGTPTSPIKIGYVPSSLAMRVSRTVRDHPRVLDAAAAATARARNRATPLYRWNIRATIGPHPL